MSANETWQAPMLLAIATGLSNACSEGCNRIVKHVDRMRSDSAAPPTNAAGTVGLHSPITASAI